MTTAIEKWAQDIVNIVNSVEGLGSIEAGPGGLGSTDGVYVSEAYAERVAEALQAAGYYYGQYGMTYDAPMFAYLPDTTTRGLMFAEDEEFPGERVLYFFDEKTW